MKKYFSVIVTKPISCEDHEFELDKDAKALLDKISRPMLEFLQEQYLKDKDCLFGDVEYLMKLDSGYKQNE